MIIQNVFLLKHRTYGNEIYTVYSWLYLDKDCKVISSDIIRYSSKEESAHLPSKCDIKFGFMLRIFPNRTNG